MSDHFSLWLGKKLTELGSDESVFGPYIVSILEVICVWTLPTLVQNIPWERIQIHLDNSGWGWDLRGKEGRHWGHPFRCSWWWKCDQSNTYSGEACPLQDRKYLVLRVLVLRYWNSGLRPKLHKKVKKLWRKLILTKWISWKKCLKSRRFDKRGVHP